jgi:hypothetical protein
MKSKLLAELIGVSKVICITYLDISPTKNGHTHTKDDSVKHTMLFIYFKNVAL